MHTVPAQHLNDPRHIPVPRFCSSPHLRGLSHVRAHPAGVSPTDSFADRSWPGDASAFFKPMVCEGEGPPPLRREQNKAGSKPQEEYGCSHRSHRRVVASFWDGDGHLISCAAKKTFLNSYDIPACRGLTCGVTPLLIQVHQDACRTENSRTASCISISDIIKTKYFPPAFSLVLLGRPDILLLALSRLLLFGTCSYSRPVPILGTGARVSGVIGIKCACCCHQMASIGVVKQLFDCFTANRSSSRHKKVIPIRVKFDSELQPVAWPRQVGPYLPAPIELRPQSRPFRSVFSPHPLYLFMEFDIGI